MGYRVIVSLVAVCFALVAAPLAQAAGQERAELLAVYRAVLESSPQLAAAQALYAAQLEQIPQARAQLLPSLTSSVSVANTRATGGRVERDTRRSGPQYQLSLRQPLINVSHWYQLRGAHSAAALAALEYQGQQQAIILETAQAYIETLRAEDERTASAAECRAFQQQLAQAQGHLAGGLSSITDVLDAQAAFDTAQASHQLSQGKVADAYELLFKLTQRRYAGIASIDPGLPITLPMPMGAERWVETAMRQNVSLAVRAAAIDIATEAASQRRAGHAPTLDATASYQRADNDPVSIASNRALEQSTLALELTIPIYSGGRTSSQVREAQGRLTAAEEQHQAQLRDVVSQTRMLYRAVHADVEQIRARQQSLLSSRASLEATQIGANTGTRNMLDVLNAHQRRFRAQRALDNARYDYVLNNLRLKSLAGTLAEKDLQELTRYMKGSLGALRAG